MANHPAFGIVFPGPFPSTLEDGRSASGQENEGSGDLGRSSVPAYFLDANGIGMEEGLPF